MSDHGSVYGIAITLLILNIVTPVFVFAFTDINIGADYSEELKYLDESDLIEAGIYLQGDEKYTLEYDGAPDYIEFVNVTEALRVRWASAYINRDFGIYTKQVAIPYTEWWLIANLIKVEFGADIYQEGLTPVYITNNTIVEHWDNDHNWTRCKVPRLGLELFFTCEAYDNNITEAIDAGLLNVTAGQALNYQNFTPLNFIAWYWGQLTGGSNYYSMPSYIAWIFRLQAILLIFSGVIIARDLIGFT